MYKINIVLRFCRFVNSQLVEICTWGIKTHYNYSQYICNVAIIRTQKATVK